MFKTFVTMCALVVFIFLAGGGNDVKSQEHKPGSVTVVFKNTSGITFVSIPAGSFLMGSNNGDDDEKPVHTVTLDGFEMGATEVTQGQYGEVMGENPSSFTGDDTLPVDKATWFNAAKFCNKLSEREGLEKCYDDSLQTRNFAANGFRLPTEAEWEYACRAGTSTQYNTGSDESDLVRAGWVGIKIDTEDREKRVTFDSKTMSHQEISQHFRVTELPSYLFIDKEGNPVHIQPGYIPKERFGPMLDYIKDELYKKKIKFIDYLKSKS